MGESPALCLEPTRLVLLFHPAPRCHSGWRRCRIKTKKINGGALAPGRLYASNGHGDLYMIEKAQP